MGRNGAFTIDPHGCGRYIEMVHAIVNRQPGVQRMAEMAVPAALLLALIAALIMVAQAVRRWRSHEDQTCGTVWTLHQLDRMRDAGEVTIEQYERLKGQAVNEVQPPCGTAGAEGVSVPTGSKTRAGDTKRGLPDETGL